MTIALRIRAATRASVIHLVGSLLVASLAALLVFEFWYPYPFSEFFGGRELFWLVVSVDVICGPLLTLVIFDPSKRRVELWRDLGIIAVIQLLALGYGLSAVWQARPLFLVLEIDRFKVIAAPDLDGAEFATVPGALRPHFLSRPLTVAIREPVNQEERQKVLFESIQGGRDYAERPNFYLPYQGANALKSLIRAKPLSVFLQKQPSQQAAATELASKKGADMAQWLYLPVVARQDWIAVLDKQGQIQGFLKGDGF